jgi:Na+/H+ antiporter NhaD/arsenite permease-like protein
MSDAYLASVVFVVTYIAIVSERIHKTTAALAGAMVLVAIKVLETHDAFEAIDLNVILLLVGMMIIANTLASTGLFQWAAIRAAKAARGSPTAVLVLLAAFTAVASAFLDNVTTVVLIAPVALLVAQTLDVPVAPGMIVLVLASNIGGTATLIGDPPNILIASHAGIDFATFFLQVGPVSILALMVFLVVVAFVAHRQLRGSTSRRDRVLAIDEAGLITDSRTLRVSLAVLAVTILGFILHGRLGYEPSVVALMGASVLMLITRRDPHDLLRDVEWSTLFFFIGLFIVVAGLEHTGVLDAVGERAVELTDGSPTKSVMLILWMSALLSGMIDNIPYTATMLPIVEQMNAALPADHQGILWWALAIGADFGGNLTVVAASANVLVANLAARAGYPISFMQFAGWGAICTVGTMALASAYMWLRYLAS